MKKTADKQKQSNAIQEAHQEKWSGWSVIVISMLGLGICLYLYSFHINLLLGDVQGGLLCGPKDGLACNSVVSSPYSAFWGLPLAVWGAIFYCVIILLGFGGIVFGRDGGPAFFRWALIGASLGLVFDLYLAYVMTVKIGTICWLCVSTYLVNAAIFVLLFKRYWNEPRPRVSLKTLFPWTNDKQEVNRYYRNVIRGFLLGAILLAFAVGAAGSRFLLTSLTGNDRERLASIIADLQQAEPIVVEVQNRPAIGPPDAKITVVEFSDFLCPFCAKGSTYLKLSQSGNHDKIRLVFRHYPLDKTCNWRLYSTLHPGACLLAEGAACAFEQDRFWPYHEIAFETQDRITNTVVLDIAQKVGLDLDAFKSCLASGRGMQLVQEDIAAGLKAGIRATPTIIVNGRIHTGVPKPWVLNEIYKFAERNLRMPE